MSLDVISLGRNAVQTASYQGYIGESYRQDKVITTGNTGSPDPLLTYLWFNAMLPGPPAPTPSGGGGGSGGKSSCSKEGLFYAAIAAVILCGIALTTASSMAANDTRLIANDFKARQLKAENAAKGEVDNDKKTIATQAAKIFGVMSTENRVSSFAFGFFAAAFAVLTATAIGALIEHVGYQFDESYLLDGVYGGGGLLTLASFIYLGSHLYKSIKKEELEQAAQQIKTAITAVNSNGFN